ncbi:hypothetical protein [Streptomyces thermolilacinus]|uniref:Phage tail protein n=1 Tax=Streptomyces thermolilacinus SPC6 TaxID=1306406 RepID=A0A1D3DRB8_9ACTN|nr:hypothetical protein [Streptomyces thermolilacinus]OEJ94869.1 hypothetical protein J116_010620 [Streptomyces thermolilacinus SPC6]
MSLVSSLNRAAGSLRGLRAGVDSTSKQMSGLKRSVDQTAAPLNRVKNSSGQAGTALSRVRTGAGQAGTAMGKVKGGADRAGSAIGRLRASATNGNSALGRLRTGLNSANSSLGRAKGGTDRFRSSLDRLKRSADKAKNSLRDVKRQADAVEKSVGKAGKGADRTGKTMGGGLSKGLKGASVAQRGLNLAMAANPFGLIMALLAPLIARFVNVDKIVSVVSRGFKSGMRAIQSAVSTAIRVITPILRGVGNVMLAPFRAFATAVNTIIGALNRFKVSIPGWVPVFGGRSFSISLPKIPIPHLAKGGVVQPRNGGTLAVIGEAGEHEAVIPLSKLERMIGPGGSRAQIARLAEAVERLADRPVHVQVDGQTIARAVIAGHRQLARR